MTEEMSDRFKAFAFYGMATNRSRPIEERLELALHALELLEDVLATLDQRLAAYEPGSDQ